MSQPWLAQSPHDHAVMDVLHAVRAFTDALDRMHGGMKGDMDMNGTDLAALRMLIVREAAARPSALTKSRTISASRRRRPPSCSIGSPHRDTSSDARTPATVARAS